MIDEKEILTRFKNGTLDRVQAAALLMRTRGMPGTAAPPAPVALAVPASAGERVAVVGIAGRYPGAPDLNAFWQRLLSGRGTASVPPPGRPGTEAGHYLERVQDFDAEFFGIDADEEGSVGAGVDPGSVRAVVGDGGAATGAAVVTRALLQLRHRVLLPEPGRREPESWPVDAGLPRRVSAGVRGAGGVDAQVILEEYLPGAQERVQERVLDRARPYAGGQAGGDAGGDAGDELFALSAPTPAHLAATAERFAALLGGGGQAPPLGVLARSLRAGRAAMDCRFAVVVADASQLVRALEEFVQGRLPCADLRDGAADPLGLGSVPETQGYLAALWRAGHLHQLRALWLSGLDIDWAGLHWAPGSGAVAVPLPASAFLRTPLWLSGV